MTLIATLFPLICWLVYGWGVRLIEQRRPSLSVIMSIQRRRWVANAARRESPMDAILSGNLMQSVSFLASTSVLLILAVFTGFGQLEALQSSLAQYHPDFVASDGPEFGAIVAFALDEPNLRALTFRPNELNYWWNREDYRGKSAIVVIDQTRTTADFQSQFAIITPVSEVPVVRFGRELNRFKIYYAEGYDPHP